MSLSSAGFSSFYDLLGVIKFCAPPRSSVSSLPAFDFPYSLFIFASLFFLSGETRHVVSSHYHFVWYLKSASSLADRRTHWRPSRDRARVCRAAAEALRRPEVLGGRRLETEVLPCGDRDAPYISDSAPAHPSEEETSWQRLLAHVLQMNISCTRSLASKPLLY